MAESSPQTGKFCAADSQPLLHMQNQQALLLDASLKLQELDSLGSWGCLAKLSGSSGNLTGQTFSLAHVRTTKSWKKEMRGGDSHAQLLALGCPCMSKHSQVPSDLTLRTYMWMTMRLLKEQAGVWGSSCFNKARRPGHASTLLELRVSGCQI